MKKIFNVLGLFIKYSFIVVLKILEVIATIFFAAFAEKAKEEFILGSEREKRHEKIASMYASRD